MAVLECKNKCTQSFFDKEDFRTNHTVTDTKEQADGSSLWKARCDECGAEDWHYVSLKPGKHRQTYKTRYPRIEPHTGKMVTSKDHERETVKRMGYYPVKGS